MPSNDPSGALILRVPSSLVMVLLWSLVGAVNLGLSMIPPVHWPEPLKVAITCLCGLALSLAVSEGARRAARAGLRIAVPVVVCSVLVGATALWAIDVLVQNWTIGHPLLGGDIAAAFLLRRFNWVYFAALFSLQAAISALVASAQTVQTRERQLVEARLAALRFQINPHFLFNTLNALSTLVAEAGADQAEEMIARLSDFLRISLATEPSGLVPLAAELEMVEAYLDIESVRFGDRLRVRYECAPDLSDAEVPILILQPLVENAVKYAVAPSREPVTILIQAAARGGNLTLTVVDDGSGGIVGSGPVSTGVGLRNVADRLEALYGSAAQLTARARERGYVAAIEMPLRRPSAARKS